ncbi:MAG: 4-alpha-glucanotransferase [Anaerolineae bacterium]|nr:4-alpha-glucanotransferase [Anaerolineae bacterium]
MADQQNIFVRSSGVLLHPTSLPGRYGIGDLGEFAYRFVDWLEAAGQTVWQILPLGPTSYGDSPYQTLSAFAGNPNLISLDKLVGAGWLTNDDLADVPAFPTDHVDYGWIIPYHDQKLQLAYQRFRDHDAPEQRAAFSNWCQQEEAWLESFALFAALKDENGGRPWVEWPAGEALRDPDALVAARTRLKQEIDEKRFRQWVFYSHWMDLKAYAAERNIRFIGDIPIFVAHDSADVWANRERFYLDEQGYPTVVAGVPPDYFSATGQRWGNPLYRWDVMKESGYDWWLARLSATLHTVDIVRIDHFRGFDAYWEIPAEEETAIKGTWVDGPGADFFTVIQRELGELPIIAEDLGVITETVEKLRVDFGLPGMKVLQFAWSEPRNPFLPHNHSPNSVVYSGTHDNNTTIGWWNREVDDRTRGFISQYLDREVIEANWTLIRLGMMSVAHTFVAPMQDILSLGSEARMNTPGVESGNWTWRFSINQLFDNGPRDRLATLTWLYKRRADQQEQLYGDVAVQE